VVGNGSFGVVF
jgi:serine/threonine protein kinase